MGEGGPEAPRPHDAAAGLATAGRGDLRHAGHASGNGARPRRRGCAQSGPHRDIPAAESHRVPERDSRPAGDRCRRLVAPAQGRCEPRVRQRRRWRALADAARTLPGGRAEGEPPGGRQSGPRAGQPHRPAAARSHAGGSRRRAAARHARRDDGPPPLPARRRLRDPDPALARSQRERRRAVRAAPARAHPRRTAAGPVHGRAEPQQGGRLLLGRGGRQGAEGPRDGRRGPARDRRDVPAEDVRPARNRAAAVPGALQYGSASAGAARGAFGGDYRSLRRARRRRHAEPPAHLRLPSRRRVRRGRVREDDSLDAGAPRLPPRRERRRPRRAAAVLSRRAGQRGFRGGRRNGAARDSRQHRVPLPHRARRAHRGGKHRVPRERRGARVAPLVLPVEQHPGRGTDRTRARRHAAPARGAGPAGAAHAGRPAGGRARHQLRRTVALSAQPGCREPRSADVPGVRRQPAPGVPPRDRAALREHRPGRPQRARPAARAVHVRQRAAGTALRHSERLRQPVPPRLTG